MTWMLGLVQRYIYDSAWLNLLQPGLNDRHEQGDKRNLITGQHKDRKLAPGKILLMPKIFVSGNEDIKEFFCSAQQFAIAHSRPSHLLNS